MPYDGAFTQPAEAYKAGVKFAFGTFNNEFVRNLPYQAATAVAFGLPYEEALKAVTINAAQIWGHADELGSVEKGKVADLMVTDGRPAGNLDAGEVPVHQGQGSRRWSTSRPACTRSTCPGSRFFGVAANLRMVGDAGLRACAG